MMQIALYAAAIVWAIAMFACFVAGAYVLWTAPDFEPFFLRLFLTLLVTPIAATLAFLPLYFVNDAYSPTLATLKKGEWQCAVSHAETVTTYVLVGKIMVPTTSTEQVCDRYERIR